MGIACYACTKTWQAAASKVAGSALRITSWAWQAARCGEPDVQFNVSYVDRLHGQNCPFWSGKGVLIKARIHDNTA
ncbi:hypothetical protein GCM10010096_25060 [Alcaligenes pakistanensis]|uniref:Uncharacterized protein n=1 Tax=Alcaligenes pakistanensis TaxID=1482717 RepID=A0A8H9M650_9BURK|nr:hypothetical protein GCM10010096_25060 [Alcaligenes pakistanensis]